MDRPLLFALAAIVSLCCTSARAEDPPLLPDPTLTPGAVDPTATASVVCNSTTKHRRAVSSATKAAVAAAYGVPRDDIGVRYEMDHLIPLAIGGSNAAANLWPQPWLEAEKKDVLEVELQRQICMGLLSQTQAQHDVAEDWVEAYRRYVLGAAAVSAATPTLRQRVTDRLRPTRAVCPDPGFSEQSEDGATLKGSPAISFATGRPVLGSPGGKPPTPQIGSGF